jgi:hypothetical protein
MLIVALRVSSSDPATDIRIDAKVQWLSVSHPVAVSVRPSIEPSISMSVKMMRTRVSMSSV